ncbi:MAG TPA: M48 family metalloprotease [Solirubrobacteraceae bacterium]|nr:M48 family metalloprotease [Solirubrobacteraceae bacterium]
MHSESGTPEPQAPAPPQGRGLGAYLIRPADISPSWVTLYAGTFALQLICATFRAGFIVYPALWILFKVFGQSTAPVNDLALLIGYGPLLLSLATLILPVGGWLGEQQMGGRSPSRREQLVFEDALATLKHADPSLRPPRRWAVLDAYHLNASVYADTLLVTRGLLESNYLEGVLAHELGHLNSSDARLAAALYRFTTPPRGPARRGLRAITMLATGGLAVWLTRAPWGAYWRSREHQADNYAAHLGQGASLAQFLETNALDNDLPVPFIWLTDTSHPPTEHRIDRLTYEP